MFGTLWSSLPELIRFMLRHFMNGVIIGWTIGLVVLRYDLSGLGRLLAAVNSGTVTVLFFAQCGLLFGVFSVCVAVMNLGADDSP